MDLDAAAEELYALPPDRFTATRKELETTAKREGYRDLAREIAGLGKPSTAAWVCNLLVRRQPEEVAGLLELGGLLREAQEGLAGDQLRALDVQRRQLLAALVRQARGLAAGEGHRVSEAVATQVEETLRAALADPDAGEALRAGRLTSALSYSGLGTGARPDLRVVPQKPPAPSRAPRGGAEQRRAEERRRAEEERRQRELDEARRAAQEAADAAEDAEDAAREEEQRAAGLAGEQQERQQRLDALAAEVDRLREEVTRGQSDLDRAQRRATSARRRATEAAGARDRARARLADLDG